MKIHPLEKGTGPFVPFLSLQRNSEEEFRVRRCRPTTPLCTARTGLVIHNIRFESGPNNVNATWKGRIYARGSPLEQAQGRHVGGECNDAATTMGTTPSARNPAATHTHVGPLNLHSQACPVPIPLNPPPYPFPVTAPCIYLDSPYL